MTWLPPPLPTRRLLLGGLGLGLAAGARAADPAGHVEEARGDVAAERAAARHPLAPPDAVYLGDTVLTGPTARAVLLLGGHTQLRLGAAARLRIDRFAANAGGVLTLDDGALLLDKDPATQRAPLSIRGVFGLIAVRGTRLFVGPSNGVTGVLLLRGVADVAAAGHQVTLREGEGTNLAGGAAPTPPQPWGAARIAAALASVA